MPPGYIFVNELTHYFRHIGKHLPDLASVSQTVSMEVIQARTKPTQRINVSLSLILSLAQFLGITIPPVAGRVFACLPAPKPLRFNATCVF